MEVLIYIHTYKFNEAAEDEVVKDLYMKDRYRSCHLPKVMPESIKKQEDKNDFQ
jgi:hypothetical protein